jgi:hypothetical protein
MHLLSPDALKNRGMGHSMEGLQYTDYGQHTFLPFGPVYFATQDGQINDSPDH